MKISHRPPATSFNATQHQPSSSNGSSVGVKKQERDFSNTLTISEIKNPTLGVFPEKKELSKNYPILSDRNITVSRELKWVYEAPKTKVEKDRLRHPDTDDWPFLIDQAAEPRQHGIELGFE